MSLVKRPGQIAALLRLYDFRPEPVTFGTWLPPLPFLRFKTPGELWREAVAEASASLPGAAGGGFAPAWSCFRCAVPPPPAGDVFGLAAARARRVRCSPVPAWQAGKLLAAFAV